MFVLEAPPLRQCKEDLPLFWRRVLEDPETAGGPPLPVAAGASLPLSGGLKKWLEEREREWLELAMREAGNSKSEAARLVDLPRKTFEHRWRTLVVK